MSLQFLFLECLLSTVMANLFFLLKGFHSFLVLVLLLQFDGLLTFRFSSFSGLELLVVGYI